MIVAILMCESLILTTGFRILIRNFIPDTSQRKKNPCKPRGIFVFPYVLTFKQPFRSVSATQNHLDLAYLEMLFCFPLECICSSSEEEKTCHWIFIVSLFLLEFYFFKNQKIPLGEELFLKVPRIRTLKVSQSCLDGLSEQSVGCSQPLYKDQENSSSTQLQVTSEQRFQGRSMAGLHCIRATFQLHNILEDLI